MSQVDTPMVATQEGDESAASQIKTGTTKSAKRPSTHLVSPVRNVFKRVSLRYNIATGESRKFNMTKEGVTVISEILYRVLVDVIAPELSPQPQLQKGKNNCPKSITAPVCREAFLGFAQVGHTRRAELGIDGITFESLTDSTARFNQFVESCFKRVARWNVEHAKAKKLAAGGDVPEDDDDEVAALASTEDNEEAVDVDDHKSTTSSRSNSDKAGVSLPHAKITGWIAGQHPKRNIMSDAKYEIVAGMEYIAIRLISECVRSAAADSKIRVDMNTVMKAKAQLEQSDDLFAGILTQISVPTFDKRCKFRRISSAAASAGKSSGVEDVEADAEEEIGDADEEDDEEVVVEVALRGKKASVSPKTPPKAASASAVPPPAPSKTNPKKRARPSDADASIENAAPRPTKVKATAV